MRHVSLLVPVGAAAVGTIEGTFVMLNKANDLLAAQGLQPAFAVHLVGLSRDAQVYGGPFSVRPDSTIDEVRSTDLVIIPAVNGDMRAVIAENSSFLPWIVERYKDGAEVASLCVGAFLLAATGLLAGRPCATHWIGASEFRRMFPDARLQPDTIITDEGGIYTSGGAQSFRNLILYLVEKHVGRETAVHLAKFYEIDIGRDSQAPFLIFNGQKDHRDETVRRAQEHIEGNFRGRITVAELCTLLAVGRRSLERRFKAATGNTVSEYIHRVKIEAAKKGLESGRRTVTEVMYEVGYTDSKAFRGLFRQTTGMSPADYRGRYGRAGSGTLTISPGRGTLKQVLSET
jgi:transcriptional regulator GlxA family with amidase domain